MQKRDRHVVAFIHRRTNAVILFPYICYMAGVSGPGGDAVELDAEAKPALIGKSILKLLKRCRKVDVSVLKKRRMENLRAYWKGRPSPNDSNELLGPQWRRLLETYPVLTKGPGTFLRQFNVWEIAERDGWRYRKVTRVVQSKSRGCTNYGESHRVPAGAVAAALAHPFVNLTRIDRRTND